MTCEKLFNKACEEKMHGRLERAYELFAEVVHNYPGTDDAIYANEEMTMLSVANSSEYDYIPSFVEDEEFACEKLYDRACEEKAAGNLERAYEIFAEVVNGYPGTTFAIYANDEMIRLSVMNATEYAHIPSYIESEAEKCEKLLNRAYEEKAHGCQEKAYELFAEVVHDYPGTIFAIYANEEMTRLSVRNTADSYTPSYVEEEAIA